MISLQTNVSASQALQQERLNQRSIQVNSRNISSGLRINYAADDPSGLAVASVMSAQIGGLTTAIENIQDNIRMIRTADSTLSGMQDILMRIRDLAVRGANEAVLTDGDRDKINNEILTLGSELERLGNSITYNTKNVLTDALDDGVQGNGEYNITEATAAQIAAIGGDVAYEKFKEKVLNMLSGAVNRSFEYFGIQKDLDTPLTVSLDFSYAGPAAATGTGTLNSIDIQINLSVVQPVSDQWLSSMLTHEAAHALTIGEGVEGTDATTLRLEMQSQYVSQEVNDRLTPGGNPLIQAQIAGPLDADVALTNEDYARAALAAQHIYSAHGRDAWVNIMDYMKQNPGATYTGDNGAIVTVLGYSDWADFETAVDAYSTAGDLAGHVEADPRYVLYQSGNRMLRFNKDDIMQVGSDNVSSNQYDIDDSLNIVDFRFMAARTTEVAQRCIDNVDHAINSISSYRSRLGGVENRLLHTLDDVNAQIINTARSKSSILDADMAKEATELTRAQIIQQSNLMALTSANFNPKVILSMLS